RRDDRERDQGQGEPDTAHGRDDNILRPMTSTDASEEIGRLRLAILAHPDDPAYSIAADNQLRLAYAAAIEAEDRPRAELITVQIEGADAPGGRAARVRDLLAKHGRGWSAVKDLVAGYRFYRGFVGHVTITARDLLERGERLFALEPITEL